MRKQTSLVSDQRKLAVKKLRDSLREKPPLEKLLSPQELADASPGYHALRQFTANLKSRRQKEKLTLQDVADRSGLALETLSRLETGALTNPTWQTLTAYAAALGRLVEIEAIPVRTRK